MALRLDLVPMHLILSQVFFEPESLRRSEGGSFMFIIATSTSPSLSKSPKAVPRLGRGSVTAGPALELTSTKRPLPRFLYKSFLCLKVTCSFLVSTSGNTWPFDIKISEIGRASGRANGSAQRPRRGR